MVVVSGATSAAERKIVAESREIAATAGGESILFLLKVPDIEVLTLHMEHEVNKKERSW
ncbi:MAG: hypothetical protein WCJ37_03770 [Syntrophus sp. (in: bacteria)]